jgi:hypothetical protein
MSIPECVDACAIVLQRTNVVKARRRIGLMAATGR